MTIQTLYGTYSDDDLKAIKRVVDELATNLKRTATLKTEFNDGLVSAEDALKIPKKILRKIVQVTYKQSFQDEVTEHKEFETLFEGVTKAK